MLITPSLACPLLFVRLSVCEVVCEFVFTLCCCERNVQRRRAGGTVYSNDSKARTTTTATMMIMTMMIADDDARDVVGNGGGVVLCLCLCNEETGRLCVCPRNDGLGAAMRRHRRE
jgi:hypothetical protein